MGELWELLPQEDALPAERDELTLLGNSWRGSDFFRVGGARITCITAKAKLSL